MNQPQFPPPGFAPTGPAPTGAAPTGYGAPTPPPRRSTGLVVGLVLASVLAVVLLASTVAFAVLWSGEKGRADDARSELAAVRQAQADDARATDVATKYTVAASTFDYRNLGPWQKALTTGVTPELKAKLDATTGAMNQMLQPLQWVSTGSDPVSSVVGRTGAVRKVAVFVKVSVINAQAPAGREVLSRYDITVDGARDWLITDVGGFVAPK